MITPNVVDQVPAGYLQLDRRGFIFMSLERRPTYFESVEILKAQADHYFRSNVEDAVAKAAELGKDVEDAVVTIEPSTVNEGCVISVHVKFKEG